MAGKKDNQRPIIIKRKKVVEGGHHGGAWKVAYADFVTAMMAFFMLMWLLNATTEKQRKGLADYFSPTIAVSRASGGGDGALGGRSMSTDASQVQLGRGGITPSEANGTAAEDATLAAIEAAIMGKGGDSLVDEELLRHVTVRLTDEGLVIEFFDLPGSPLFEGEEPTHLMSRLLASVAPALREHPNALAIEAYTAAEPVVTREPMVWPLSSARADAIRRALPEADVVDGRVVRVTGHADRRPAASDPLSSRNNRIEIVVIRDRVAPRR
ncbi:flagellar motor protein MotB [Jannaschia rubra]|uniref:Chemotaxis protein MotB n=1 Tax=Jannaschia rubra TaxID=282197 RepID=A0A0M6XUN1_9RHOB|nr:flagellar motor protein MotB [Jannaschia rubra]CTQ33634.1 Chemotaxis protein MotB [Jannaschia rubra]SFG05352.1 chemotaxis protein MotB [Jannaschia rubra]